ncbi:MAG: tripartite tricarboxylate transporter substrate-binding protein [Rhodoferax sp.]
MLTVVEVGVPGFEAQGRFALMGPAGLPEPIVATLRKALADVLATPTVAARLEAIGQIPASPRFDVRATIATELVMWKKLISERKITIDG